MGPEDMTDFPGVAAPLAAALSARGFAGLTPVQAAMTDPGLAGRDAVVSAQTGSGKTVAFGLALAADLLGEGEAMPVAGAPAVLVVAPTRELALQVREELAWLYGPAGAVLASCVGGMDFRTERRALERGAQIVVGTPGRLRDHVERGSLDLSALQAVVLDEADEMLDLGFREDLEFLLGAAPAERRTLLFSATVPPAIAELAATFQRDAVRIVAGGEARAHADIAYRAVTVAPRDREGAIFNILRLHDARLALVFVKTRANVNHLIARMGNRGFQVVALSGELSQQDRTLALQSLRSGRARICVATDVAARGIDLPGLDLVIHADLPSNPETLLHRSGRTGRAGSKGTAFLIVTPADARKAARLLREAKVTADWEAPPSAEAVQAAEDARLLAHPALGAPLAEEEALVAALVARHGAPALAAAFLRLWREGRSAPEEIAEPAAAPPPRAPEPKGPRAPFGPSVWFRLSAGHSRRAEARWILPKICEAGSIGKEAIGAIRVQTEETHVEIALAEAPRFGDRFEIEPGLTLVRMDGPPSSPPPRGSARPAARGGPAERPARDRPRPAAPQALVPERPVPPVAPPAPVAAPVAPAPVAPVPVAPAPVAPAPAAGAPEARPAPERGAPPPRKPPQAGKAAEGGARPPRARPLEPGGPARSSERAPRPAAAEAADAARPDRKPRWKGGKHPDAAPAAPGGSGKPFRSHGTKSHGAGPGGEGKPARSAGYKSHRGPAGEGAPGKGAAPRPPKPATPPADARDTSRRFTPPKPPKPKA
jgi:ATP-dependent RNA helicase DeaD